MPKVFESRKLRGLLIFFSFHVIKTSCRECQQGAAVFGVEARRMEGILEKLLNGMKKIREFKGK